MIWVVLILAAIIVGFPLSGAYLHRELRRDVKQSDLRDGSTSTRRASRIIGGKAESAIPLGSLVHLLAGPMPAERTVEPGVLKESHGSDSGSDSCFNPIRTIAGVDANALPTPTTARRITLEVA